jgi:hypothetical protein
MLKRIDSVLNRQSAVIKKLEDEIDACEARKRYADLIVAKSREIAGLRQKLGALRAKEPDQLASVKHFEEEIERIKREVYPVLKPNLTSLDTVASAGVGSGADVDVDADAPVP